jgi:hypothetical protein
VLNQFGGAGRESKGIGKEAETMGADLAYPRHFKEEGIS